MIAANETVKVLDRLGPDANVTMAEAKRIKDAVTEILDGEDGLKDGIVSCRTPSKAQQQKIEAALRTFLNEKQLDFLRALAADFALPYPLNHGSGTSYEDGATITLNANHVLRLPGADGCGPAGADPERKA